MNILKVLLKNTSEPETNKVTEILDDPEIKLYNSTESLDENPGNNTYEIYSKETDKNYIYTQENLVPETIKDFNQTFSSKTRNMGDNLQFRADDTLNDVRQLNLSFINTE